MGIAERIEKAREQSCQAGRRRSPQSHPRASSIGDCPREVYYQVTAWDQRPPIEDELLHRFERGREVERVVTRKLLDLGFEIKEQQLGMVIKDSVHIFDVGERELTIMTGHMDGVIVNQPGGGGFHHGNPCTHCGLKADPLAGVCLGSEWVYEIKSLHPNVWARVHRLEDFLDMGGFWRRYPRQILAYMHNKGLRHGLMILDDCLGHWKLIEVELTEDWLAFLTDTMEIATEAAIGIETDTPPEYLGDLKTCRSCWAFAAGVCHPPMAPEGEVQIIEDVELPFLLDRLEEIRETGREYSRLDKKFKADQKARGPGTYIAGDYRIDTTAKPGTKFNVPDEIKRAYAEPTLRITTKVVKMGGGDDGQ